MLAPEHAVAHAVHAEDYQIEAQFRELSAHTPTPARSCRFESCHGPLLPYIFLRWSAFSLHRAVPYRGLDMPQSHGVTW